MAALGQLRDVESYRPCDWDLRADAAGRAHWVGVFRWHLDAVIVPLVRREYPEAEEGRIAALRADYLARFTEAERRPEAFERLDVLTFTLWRREFLLRHGFEDPFLHIKERANAAALELRAGVLAEIDAASVAEQERLLALGLMAGNLFDLGSKATANHHAAVNEAFRQTREGQPARPWRFDDVDAWWQRVHAGGHRHVVFFVDNAGGDVLLGCLPLARWLAQRGSRVTLAANTGAALNDVLAAELTPLLEECARKDPVLRGLLDEGRLDVAATGCVAPLLDLGALDAEFVERVADGDLVVLHGMGRGVESNFDARFRCDVLRTAVLKDEAVAARHGARVFDCVFRFAAGGGGVTR